MVSTDQHIRDAFAEKNRAEVQLHDALVKQLLSGKPPTKAEQETLDSLAAFADNANKLWVKSWPARAE